MVEVPGRAKQGKVMADVKKTIEILFMGTDKLSGTIGDVAGKVADFSGSIQDATKPLLDMSVAILKVDAVVGALAVGGLALAYAKSIEFEGAVIDLQKVIGDEGNAMQGAIDTALELSNAYGTSATDVLQSAANFKQAGFDIEGSLILTKSALDLMIAGDVEASAASELLIATLKGFNAPAEEAARVVDILNAVSNEYATNVNELAIGMAELSPIASTMGFSFEETAGILTPVRNFQKWW